VAKRRLLEKFVVLVELRLDAGGLAVIAQLAEKAIVAADIQTTPRLASVVAAARRFGSVSKRVASGRRPLVEHVTDRDCEGFMFTLARIGLPQ
jgi:hypothetical protein